MPKIHQVGDLTFQHSTHPRSRSIKIRVTQTGQVLVTSPKSTPLRRISSFVLDNKNWIDSTVQSIKANQYLVNSDHMLRLFGQEYQKKIVTSSTIPLGVHLDQRTAIINPVQPTKESQEKTITRFLKATAQDYIVPRTHDWATKMGVTFNNISLKQQKTRWGSCSSKRNLNFNWRLVHYHPEKIDYVIVHELAHLTHLDHSPAFWALVAKHMPEYQRHRNWLSKHGLTIG